MAIDGRGLREFRNTRDVVQYPRSGQVAYGWSGGAVNADQERAFVRCVKGRSRSAPTRSAHGAGNGESEDVEPNSRYTVEMLGG
jgi:hypothetical protein